MVMLLIVPIEEPAAEAFGILDVGERSGQLRPYVRPARGTRRWPSWVCACVSGTNLTGVLGAHCVKRYGLNCLDHSLSHHAG
jgi:hypothetical protein